MLSRYSKLAGAAGVVALFAAAPAFAQEAAAAAPAAAPFTPTADMVNKGDTTWMLVSSALVLMMSVPALALFYGGLVRSKNMLSVLMQVLTIVSVAALVWVGWGYSLAFTGGGPFVGGLSKAFLKSVDASTLAATFSNGVYIPEYAFIVFQMTFACITPALIVGAFAERIKFWPLIIFVVLWLTIVYFPIAHMVWYWAGPWSIPSQANFIMVDLKRPVVPVRNTLMQRKIQVGRLFPALPNHLRLTIGTKPEMETFLAAFREIMAPA